MRSTTLAIALLVASVLAGRAQTSPADGNAALVLPPELRGGSATAPGSASPAKPQHGRTREPNALRAPRARPVANTEVRPQPDGVDHPMAFGLQVHGGAGDPQHYSVTSGSPAGEETGNGAAVGLKVGF